MKALTQEEMKKFETDAYLHLRHQLFSEPDFIRMKKHLSAFCEALPEEVRHQNFINHYKIKPKVADIITSPAILNLAEQILGANLISWSFGICYKPANSSYRVPAHMDSHFWIDWDLLQPNEVLGIFIPLTDLTKENGCLNVLPGVNAPVLYNHKSVDEKTNFFMKEIDDFRIDLSKMIPIEMKANEVCLFKENLIHSSESNKSNFPRIAITLRFISAKTKYNPHPKDAHSLYLAKGKSLLNEAYVKEFSSSDFYGGYSWSEEKK